MYIFSHLMPYDRDLYVRLYQEENTCILFIQEHMSTDLQKQKQSLLHSRFMLKSQLCIFLLLTF